MITFEFCASPFSIWDTSSHRVSRLSALCGRSRPRGLTLSQSRKPVFASWRQRRRYTSFIFMRSARLDSSVGCSRDVANCCSSGLSSRPAAAEPDRYVTTGRQMRIDALILLKDDKTCVNSSPDRNFRNHIGWRRSVVVSALA